MIGDGTVIFDGIVQTVQHYNGIVYAGGNIGVDGAWGTLGNKTRKINLEMKFYFVFKIFF